MPYTLSAEVARAIRQRKPFTDRARDLQGYRSRGGSYLVATCGRYSDDEKPHDLVLVQPPAPNDPSVGIMLRPNVHPDLVAALALALVGE